MSPRLANEQLPNQQPPALHLLVLVSELRVIKHAEVSCRQHACTGAELRRIESLGNQPLYLPLNGLLS